MQQYIRVYAVYACVYVLILHVYVDICGKYRNKHGTIVL